MMISVKNPVWANEEKTAVSCDVIIPWISTTEYYGFCAYRDGDTEFSRSVFSSVKAGNHGPVAPFVRSVAVPQIVSRAQFKLALLDLGLLDDVDALVAASNNTALQINWADRQEVERNHPLVIATAAALGKTEAEIDALFVLAASK